MDSAAVKQYLLELQELIVERLEQVDGKQFLRDQWTRPDGSGGGLSCILEEGNVIERGGVAFSHVTGDKMPVSATQHRPELAGCRWEAMGVSLVMHPRNPYAPTSHATCACSWRTSRTAARCSGSAAAWTSHRITVSRKT